MTFTQEIVKDYPPIWDEIRKAFKLSAGAKVIFAFGDRVYNPSGIDMPDCLIQHEKVHGIRQIEGIGVDEWWKRYMDDPVFRLNEEIPAHIAELESLMKTGNRNDRRLALKQTAKRLSAGLYGGLISKVEAQRLLKASQRYRNV